MNAFVGTGSLVRLALRRDRIMLPIWILVFVAVAASSAASAEELFPTVESRVSLATSANANPSLVALYGWVFDGTSLGSVAMYKTIAFGAATVAILAMLITTRHTRAEEESGRLELIGATVVGRYAALTAALIVSSGASLVLGVLSALALIGGGLPASGSFAFGLAWAAAGISFAGIAAVAAQLTEGARAANGIAASALGVAYLLRAIGDSTGTNGPTWVSWLSPIGWGQQVRPYAGDRWWVLLLPVLFTVALVAGAYALIARRDLGAGLVRPRPGPERGALGSPLALAWRLQRGSVIGWSVGFVVAGLVFGGVAGNVGDLLDSPQAKDFIVKLGGQQGLIDAYLATEMGLVGLLAAAFAIQSAGRLRSEETALRAEPVLAGAVSRWRWAGSHIVFALVGTAVMLAVTGAAAGLTYGATTDMGQFGRVFGAALAQIPAAWVLAGIVVLVFGFLPQLNITGWAALAAFAVVGFFGPILRLPQWLMDISPFVHIPKLPGTPFTATPLLWLTGLAVVALAAGLTGFRRRDLTSG